MKYPKVIINRKTKLSKQDVKEIRKLRKQNVKLKDIAKKYGVHISTIYYKTTADYDKIKAIMRKRNNEKYKNDPVFREHIKKLVNENQKKRMEIDPAYKKYKREMSKKWNREHRR